MIKVNVTLLYREDQEIPGIEFNKPVDLGKLFEGQKAFIIDQKINYQNQLGVGWEPIGRKIESTDITLQIITDEAKPGI